MKETRESKFEKIIEVKNVTKVFDDVTVIDDINLSIKRAGVMWELCVLSFFHFSFIVIIIIIFFPLKEFRSQLFPVRLKL